MVSLYNSDTYHYLLRKNYKPQAMINSYSDMCYYRVGLPFDGIFYTINDYGYLEEDRTTEYMDEILENRTTIINLHHDSIKKIVEFIEDKIKSDVYVCICSGKILNAMFYSNRNYIASLNMGVHGNDLARKQMENYLSNLMGTSISLPESTLQLFAENETYSYIFNDFYDDKISVFNY